MDCLSEIDDPRKPSSGILHGFREILVISIAAMLSDSDTVEDIAFWARKKEAWLRRFLVLNSLGSRCQLWRGWQYSAQGQRSAKSVVPEEDRAQPDWTGYYRQDQSQLALEAQGCCLG